MQLQANKALKTGIPNSRKMEMLDTKKSAGRPTTNPADVLRVQNRFQQSPTVSLRRASIELNLPPSTVHNVLKKTLHYKTPLQNSSSVRAKTW
jgi:hypothetical protein